MYLVLSLAMRHSRWGQWAAPIYVAKRNREETGTHLSAGDDDVLHPVLNLHRPVWVPHGQIPRVEVSAIERASCRVGVLEVTLHDDVATQDDLADRFAIAWDVDEVLAGFGGTNDAEWERGREGVPLMSSKLGSFRRGKRSPGRLGVVASEGTISLAVVCGSGSEWKN